MVNGQMREATEGRVEWPDLDVDTFLRFAKFVYSRDYTEAEPEVPPKPEPEAPEASTQEKQPSRQRNSTNQEEESDDETGDESGDDISGDESQTDYDNTSVEGYDDYDDGEEEEGFSEDQSQDSSGTARRSADDRRPQSQRLPAPIPEFLPYCISDFYESFQQVYDFNRDSQNRRKRRRPHWDDGANSTLMDKVGHKIKVMENFMYLNGADPDCPIRPVHTDRRWTPCFNEDPKHSYEGVFLSHARLYFLADKYDIDALKKLSIYRLHETLLGFQVFIERVPDLVRLAAEIYTNTVENDVARKLITLHLSCFVEDIRSCEELRGLIRSNGDFAGDMFDQMAWRLSSDDEN